jgi:leucyl aminopeptidase
MSPPRLTTAGAVPRDVPVLGVPVFSDLSTPPGAGAQLDAAYLAQRRFKGEPGEALALLADDGTTVVALGVGAAGSVGPAELRRAGAALSKNAGDATEVATTLAAAAAGPAGVAAAAEGVGLGAYRYAGAPKRNGSERRVQRAVMVGAGAEPVRQAQAAVDATWRARDWINRPARDLTPRALAAAVVEAASGTGVVVDVWDEGRVEAERLGGLLGVASGAAEPPRLIHLTYAPPPGRAGRAPEVPFLAFVGKGITFDSGGLSLKPPAAMMTMKMDMGGAAAVVCATLAIAELGLPVRLSTWVAATENMPSGTAIHPGDVLVARNGKSIEVLNTDAEGRLVLADALSLAAEEGPDAIVDVATLTGGQRVALGDSVAAVFGTDAGLVSRVVAAGDRCGEPAWELPLFTGYRKLLDSDYADLRNVTGNTAASSTMAALFLREFAGEGPWAHLDIAGPAWAESEDGWLAKGATGWGARTLIELARGWTDGAAPLRKPG